MKPFRLSRREWMLFLFPLAILGLSHLDKLRALDGSELALTLNPFARARENARRSSCQSQLKQIGLAFMQYTQDYEGRFPLNATPKGGWVYGHIVYSKNCPILQCPNEPNTPVPMVPDYWMNGNLNENGGKGRGLKLTQLDRPDHTFLLGDGDGLASSGNYTLTEKTWQSKAPYAVRHLFGSNFSFADGHVKWLKPALVNAGRDKAACCTSHTFKTEIIRANAPHNHAAHSHLH